MEKCQRTLYLRYHPCASTLYHNIWHIDSDVVSAHNWYGIWKKLVSALDLSRI